jgi:hypothetical protein
MGTPSTFRGLSTPLVGNASVMKRFISGAALILAAMSIAACGDDSGDEVDEAVDEAREDVEDVAGTVGARAAAEALRGILESKDLASDQTLRDVTVLQDAVGDIPGDPEVSGIEDADGDAKDDDGKVTVAVGDQQACVTVADNGEISVSGDAC